MTKENVSLDAKKLKKNKLFLSRNKAQSDLSVIRKIRIKNSEKAVEYTM